MQKLEWDTAFDDEFVLTSCHEFLDHISLSSSLHTPRYLLLNKPIKKIEIDSFADARMSAYGDCLYLRAFYEKSNKIYPRLELCATKLSDRIFNIYLSF